MSHLGEDDDVEPLDDLFDGDAVEGGPRTRVSSSSVCRVKFTECFAGDIVVGTMRPGGLEQDCRPAILVEEAIVIVSDLRKDLGDL